MQLSHMCWLKEKSRLSHLIASARGWPLLQHAEANWQPAQSFIICASPPLEALIVPPFYAYRITASMSFPFGSKTKPEKWRSSNCGLGLRTPLSAPPHASAALQNAPMAS